MVVETASGRGERSGVVTRVAGQLGFGPESLRKWVHQAEVDGGKRSGLTSGERERMKLLECANRELRRANEILMSTAAFFGAELDRRSSTAAWVAWWNAERFHSACGAIQPAEFEVAHHSRLQATEGA